MSAAIGFHAGEQALQARVGVRERLAAYAPQILREHMPDQHRELFGKLPTLLLGALDAAGRPWATMLAGPPGFVTTPDARTLRIADVSAADDPALASLHRGAPVGLLGLEPQTRRRNRMNGVVEQWADGGALTVGVRQSFGNCPKYIVGREPEAIVPQPAPAVALGPRLDAAAKALIRGADTLFIASSAARPEADGVDVSHRGGPPGFVRLDEDGDEDEGGAVLLTLPDFAGNQFFMTLGNLSQNPAAGLLFVDYDGGGLLHLSVDAAIDWHDEPGRRAIRLRVRGGVWRAGVLPWRWRAAGG